MRFWQQVRHAVLVFTGAFTVLLAPVFSKPHMHADGASLNYFDATIAHADVPSDGGYSCGGGGGGGGSGGGDGCGGCGGSTDGGTGGGSSDCGCGGCGSGGSADCL